MTAALATAVEPAPAARRGRSTAWWGMVLVIATEAMIFAGLLSSYFFVRAGAVEWPQGGIEEPELARVSIFTVVLLGSSLPLFWAEAGIRAGNVRRLRLGLLLSFVLGAVFLANQALEYEELQFGWSDNAYGSLFYGITGLHGLHVAAGLAMSLVVHFLALNKDGQ